MRQSQLVLQYVRFAVPKMTEDAERSALTFGFSDWLSDGWPQGHKVPDAPAGLLAAFEACYLAELGVVDRPVRCQRALDGLQRLIGARGAGATVALFRKGGRGALEERLRACARAKDPSIQETAQKVLENLSRK